MSKAVPFLENFFESPESDPLNKTDLFSRGEAPAPPPGAQHEQRQRGLDSVFAASSAFDGPASAAPQKAVLVTRTARTTNGLDELNQALRSGWELMHVTLMGDSEKNASWVAETEADAYFSALVFIEQIDAT